MLTFAASVPAVRGHPYELPDVAAKQPWPSPVDYKIRGNQSTKRKAQNVN